jgi:phosphate transport system protein
MRSARGAQLAALTDQLAGMCRLAGTAMERATLALLDADLPLAEQVISDHANIVSVSAEIEETGFLLLTRQAPMARDRRAVVGVVQIVADIERMGVLARHVAEIARRRHPHCALPEDVTGHFADMGRIALDLAASAHHVIVSCDLRRARYIRDADDAMDNLHRHLFTVMMDDGWPHGTGAAVDVTLLGRYYERFADHAVEISRRIIFQATGHVRDEERILAHY